MNTKTIWTVVVGAAILATILISYMFQPSGLDIKYDSDSYFQVRKLFFAAGVLAVLGFMLILCIAIYMTLSQQNPANAAGKDIFDSMIKVIPPIMTLVLGYYFGQQSVVRPNVESSNATSNQSNKEAARDQKSAADTKDASTGGTAGKDPKVTNPNAPSTATSAASGAAEAASPVKKP